MEKRFYFLTVHHKRATHPSGDNFFLAWILLFGLPVPHLLVLGSLGIWWRRLDCPSCISWGVSTSLPSMHARDSNDCHTPSLHSTEMLVIPHPLASTDLACMSTFSLSSTVRTSCALELFSLLFLFQRHHWHDTDCWCSAAPWSSNLVALGFLRFLCLTCARPDVGDLPAISFPSTSSPRGEISERSTFSTAMMGPLITAIWCSTSFHKQHYVTHLGIYCIWVWILFPCSTISPWLSRLTFTQLPLLSLHSYKLLN